MQNALEMYNEIAKAWVMKAIKKPLLSIINEQNLNFDFNEPGISIQEADHRLMKMKVRVKGILQGFVEHTNAIIMPIPLIIFMASLCKEKTYVVDGFMFPFEFNRLQLDEYGAIMKIDNNLTKMICGIYLISKILVAKVLLNPTKAGLTMSFTDVQLRNFKMLASLIHHSFMEYMT
mmetsp:Transcript_38198/g.36559  ORF Transcript_38198/g.36559 Transcript_38198/m.36559 type:complete len:176 (+) Transcript_38198:103-630(+)|eukprot:CAMPEP_0170550396 /NCGR_PEP_ID=MMETSP0211-20121228/8465_1 /TAXON_ID=311385 /ORGANISM="Pseudokeronopsis sp., Strain OXSARD2" /LENGTH=175 /DNA_ID=CAMNT_0010856927 /DNA_START=815 /DNA_END=1342 /DNA_ORIENTATION=-